MTVTSTSRISGLWIPLITPFRDGRIDEASFVRLIRHLLSSPIDGMIVAATTGEGLTLSHEETKRLAELAATTIAGRVPLHLGIAGADTRALGLAIEGTRRWPVEGYLVSCPSYVRPSQEGLRQHFLKLADAAGERPLVVYNIPYRTGINLANDTLLRLVEERPNIAGIKDCCADPQQSVELIGRRPPGFAVLTGEDAQYFSALTHGADGGITASAHVNPGAFAKIRRDLLAGESDLARAAWHGLVDMVRLFFAEPNPAPVKHWLWRQGLIASPELRLPMTGVTAVLAGRLDRLMQSRGVTKVAAE